jgi:hypothetical protein
MTEQVSPDEAFRELLAHNATVGAREHRARRRLRGTALVVFSLAFLAGLALIGWGIHLELG